MNSAEMVGEHLLVFVNPIAEWANDLQTGSKHNEKLGNEKLSFIILLKEKSNNIYIFCQLNKERI